MKETFGWEGSAGVEIILETPHHLIDTCHMVLAAAQLSPGSINIGLALKKKKKGLKINGNLYS